LRELILRAIIGGAMVTVFAEFGDLFKPRRFAGHFGAAPSVALATLGLTIASQGKNFAELEARSMLAGAALSWQRLRSVLDPDALQMLGHANRRVRASALVYRGLGRLAHLVSVDG